MLPSVVFTQLNDGHCAAFLPLPLSIGKWSQPAASTLRQHDRPSLTMLGAGGEARPGQLGDLGFAEALDHEQLQAPRLAVEARFDRSDERCLAGRTAPTLAAAAHAAEISVVELDPAAHLRLAGVAFRHGGHQLLLHQPGGRLPHTQSSRQLDRADPALGLRQLVDRAKPRRQRQLRAVEDRARREPRLMLAGVTLDLLPALHPRILFTAAPLTDKAAAPAHLEQHRQALRLGPEPRPKRQTRSIHASWPPDYSLCSPPIHHNHMILLA